MEQPQLETSRRVQTSSPHFQFGKCGFPAPDLRQAPDCPKVLWNLPSGWCGDVGLPQAATGSCPCQPALWLCLDTMGPGLGEGRRLQRAPSPRRQQRQPGSPPARSGPRAELETLRPSLRLVEGAPDSAETFPRKSGCFQFGAIPLAARRLDEGSSSSQEKLREGPRAGAHPARRTSFSASAAAGTARPVQILKEARGTWEAGAGAHSPADCRCSSHPGQALRDGPPIPPGASPSEEEEEGVWGPQDLPTREQDLLKATAMSTVWDWHRNGQTGKF